MITEFNTEIPGGKAFNEYENEILILKADIQRNYIRNEGIINELNNKLDDATDTLEHLRRKEDVLKEELDKKEGDLLTRQKLIEYIRGEFDKISVRNSKLFIRIVNSFLKKDNLSLKETINKLQINDMEGKARHFIEMQGKHQ